MININYEEYIDRSAEGLRVPSNAACEIPEYYDKKWEFPRQKLTVEETIGEGEFGKVLKAVAEGIGNGDGEQALFLRSSASGTITSFFIHRAYSCRCEDAEGERARE